MSDPGGVSHLGYVPTSREHSPTKVNSARPVEEAGQSTVELAMILPAVVLLLLAVVQVTVLVRDQLELVRVAGVGARAAALDHDTAAIGRALVAVGIDPGDLRFDLDGAGTPGSISTLQVSRRATRVPLVGGVLGDLELKERLSFRVEGPS